MAEKSYRSHKSNTVYIVTGTPTRAFLQVNGEMATNPKVLKQISDVRKGAYDFATVDWMARQLTGTY